MLDFHRSTKGVHDGEHRAGEAAFYRSSVQKWRNYAAELQPVVRAARRGGPRRRGG